MEKSEIRKPYSAYNTGYVKSIDDYERFRESESLELLKKLRNGDKSARDKLIIGNLYLVFSSAKPFTDKGLEISDLISIGTIGLIYAIDMYDVSKGTSFSNYAHTAITNSIVNGLLNEPRLVRVPTHQKEKFKEYSKIESDERSVKDIKKIFGSNDIVCNNLFYSLNDPDYYGVNQDVIDNLDTRNGLCNSVEEDFMSENLKEDVRNAIFEANLSDEEKNLLNLRFGFDGEKVHTYSSIAEIIGSSPEGARLKILNILSKLSRSSKIESYCCNKEEKRNMLRIRNKSYYSNSKRKTEVK